MTLNTIIVEDEPLSRVYLNNLLTQFCPEVNVIGKAGSLEEAIALINSLAPDLVFLDIELHSGTGFEVLKRVSQAGFQVIFTTALDHYAIKIIEMSGVDFLQKPIDTDELQSAISRVISKLDGENSQTALQHLLQTLNNNNKPLYLFLPSEDRVEYVFIDDIVRIEAGICETFFVLKSGDKKRVRRNLKDYEALLNDLDFYRVHNQHIINTREVNRGKTIADFVTMNDDAVVPISSKKREEVISFLNR